MQIFPHFHWIAIEGKRPNIPENFIREEMVKVSHVSSVNGVNNTLNGINTTLNTNTISNNNAEIKSDTNAQPIPSQPIQQTPQKGQKVIQPVIHNISKELQIFLENFELRFRKEIKTSKLSNLTFFSVSTELQISLNVIENEPGVVELLPYIIEFLMNNLSNKQYLKDPKVHILILHYINAILQNVYFFIEPYLHQIVTLILSLILMENHIEALDLAIHVKDYAVRILKIIFTR